MNKVSKEVQEQAMKIAKGTQRPNQTKEQTKLISQGIEKGIAEYKKQQNKKLRERDKVRKAQLKEQKSHTEIANTPNTKHIENNNNRLPWILLAASWLGFISWYYY
ncbi:DUF2956 domain-containing protein [Colwellia sp. E150_009]|jgi:hypothetical protein